MGRMGIAACRVAHGHPFPPFVRDRQLLERMARFANEALGIEFNTEA
jgi:hypothetical protein